MGNANALTTTEDENAIALVSLDIGADFIKENLPAEKRTELAVVAQGLKLDLASNVAKRTIRLQSSSADIDQTLGNAAKLARGKADFVIHSTHETASGMTEITVRYSPIAWIILAMVGFVIVVCMLR